MNTALALQHLGFSVDVDFIASADSLVWLSTQPQPSAQEIAAAVLPAAKTARIAQINAECRARLIARFGDAAEQVSRSLGIYGATEKQVLEDGIVACIDASNTASNAVLAAADTAAVEAVTVSWPSI